MMLTTYFFNTISLYSELLKKKFTQLGRGDAPYKGGHFI
jgi:hypothetical protein